MNVRAILTDIEGTTSSIHFVHNVLFPYAADRLPGYVERHADNTTVMQLLDDTRALAEQPGADTAHCVEILLQWIAEDSKATPLKTLQGMIWKQGFEQGDFTGHVYDDATQYLIAWHERGLPLYIYSSGSVEAQKLYFSHSDAGDLLPLFSGHFDTRIGTKREQASYAAIAEHIGLATGDILFLSDVVEELDAAHEAGMQTVQLVRGENMKTGDHAIARSFADVTIR